MRDSLPSQIHLKIKMKEYIDLLEKLVEIPTIPGFETEHNAALRQICEKYSFDKVYSDRIGNTVLVKRAADPNGKLALDAHIDEIGFRVRSIEDGGYITAVAVGGIDPVILKSSRVTVHGKEKLHGVVSLPSPDEKGKYPYVYIDVGYSREDVEGIISIGDAVTFSAPIRRIGGGLLLGRAFDDKALAACLILAVSKTDAESLAFDVYVTLSSREEVGGGGAAGALSKIAPDGAIITDVNFATAPGVSEEESAKLGAGPMTSVSAVTDRRLTNTIISTAENNNIPLSVVVEATNTGTNANLLEALGCGIPCAVLSLPEAGMHTYSECISLADAEDLIKLVRHLLTDRALAKELAERRVFRHA